MKRYEQTTCLDWKQINICGKTSSKHLKGLNYRDVCDHTILFLKRWLEISNVPVLTFKKNQLVWLADRMPNFGFLLANTMYRMGGRNVMGNWSSKALDGRAQVQFGQFKQFTKTNKQINAKKIKLKLSQNGNSYLERKKHEGRGLTDQSKWLVKLILRQKKGRGGGGL